MQLENRENIRRLTISEKHKLEGFDTNVNKIQACRALCKRFTKL